MSNNGVGGSISVGGYSTSPSNLNTTMAMCQTINDLNSPPPSRSSQSSDLLEQTIQKSFSNWSILNESFSNGHIITLDDCGVALDQVRETYRILLEMPVNIIRAMMKSIETILKQDIKFLMIILEVCTNPLLSQHNFPQESQYHHNIVKRVFGLLSNLSNELHHFLVNWFMRYSTAIFRKRVDLVNSFISYRLNKQQRVANTGTYETDWRVGSAARVMALLFAANKQQNKIPLSEFYNTFVDYFIQLINDFDTWEQRSGLVFISPLYISVSMGGKMQIMEYDAKRQMDSKAKEAFFTILFQKRVTAPHLILRIRRDFLIEDSLSQIAANELELKKSLRIEFIDEDGVDAGGLRKEWFLLLVRHLFDPQFGMFTWDEDSNLCWFNPTSFETSDQYFLVGVVIGLAIYNSTILDVHFPLACYKKLFGVPVDLEDLKVFRPAFARGLEQLLTFEGDVRTTFCRDFVAEYNAYGEVKRVPLIPNGENIPLTEANRKAKQFDPFKRGFTQVCGGNALSLFQPEEIELLVRGSAEPLEIEQLRAVTVYEGFRENEESIQNFWSIFKQMDPPMQRKLLTFVTGTDRIPATGFRRKIEGSYNGK
ncbi:232_t:CDS:10 [Diversispora eburnea]|uniref:HECT-type E3 ubiquitin transferase n=1 Tax=Diversispora eburnea TaxID=1213867 RepID=A0A9N8ZFR6_9GLOM|nr:232_t:CDS:10 [Diversispora eburnea]